MRRSDGIRHGGFRGGALLALALGFFAFPLFSEDFVYRDRASGDQAFAAKDYAVAASFYAKYREEAEKNENPSLVRDACEREIDALILGRMPEMASRVLVLYKEKFGGVKGFSLNLWEGDILLLKGKYAEASAVFRKVVSGLTLDDPRRKRALMSLADVQERLKDFSGAAETYRQVMRKPLSGTDSLDPAFVENAFLRRILCLAAAKDIRSAFSALSGLPSANSAEKQDIRRLLGIYLTLKTDGVSGVRAAWRDALADFGKNQGKADPLLMYVLFSACGDEFRTLHSYEYARQAYEAAFQTAPSKDASFQTVQRLIVVLELEKNPAEAAKLAVKSMMLFQTSAALPESRLRIAGILRGAGRRPEAEKLYRSIISNPAADAETRMKAIWECAGNLSEMGRTDEIESFLNENLTTPEQKRKGKVLLAGLYFKKSRFRKAAELYGRVAGEFPASESKYLAKAAEAYLLEKMPEQAFACVERLARLDKNTDDDDASANALYLRGRVFEQLGRTAEAVDAYLSYAKLPNAREKLAADALFKAARMEFLRRNSETAEKLFEELLKRYPDDALAPVAAFWRIHSFRSRGERKMVEEETRTLVAKYPKSDEAIRALFILAEHYETSGRPGDANRVYDDIFARNSNRELRAKVITEKAMLAMLSKDYAKARGHLMDIFTSYPDTSALARAYFIYGNILHTQGDFSQAAVSYGKALAKNPEPLLKIALLGAVGDSFYALAGAKNVPEQYEKAFKAYQKVLELRDVPGTIRIKTLYSAGDCARKAGNDERALRCFREALYMLRPDSGDFERMWGAKSAEAVIAIANERPLRIRVETARTAVNRLVECGILDADAGRERLRALDRLVRRPVRR